MGLANFSFSVGRDEGELDQARKLLMEAFGIPPERAATQFEFWGKENGRMGRIGEEVVATLMMIPMGQYWGGRSVPMTGFGGVAVGAEWRSRGVGVEMMKAAVRELWEKGCPLATLYPATAPVYRKVGFEIAGSNLGVKIPLAPIDLREPGVEVRAMRGEDQEMVRGMYRRFAAEHPGNLDRNETMWKRVEDFRGLKRRGYVLEHAGQVEGYFYCGQDRTKEGRLYVDVGDVVVTTAAAGRRFWQFLADHRSMVEVATWLGSPHDPLMLLLREPARELVGMPCWMLRIVRVVEALEKRGYGLGVSTEVHLRVRDELLTENAGDYVLTVEEGRGRVTRGGRGSLEMDVRGLAALYSGSVSAGDLKGLGWIGGPEEELAPAEAIFAGPAPWMRDAF